MRSCSSIPLWHWRWHVATWHLGLKARKTNGGREVFWNSSPIWREENNLFQAWFLGFHVQIFLGVSLGFLGWFFCVTRNLWSRIWGNIPGFCAAGRVCFSMWRDIHLRWRLGPWNCQEHYAANLAVQPNQHRCIAFENPGLPAFW